MNIVPLILAIAAFGVFLVHYWPGGPRNTVPFGLALLTGALIVQFVVLSGQVTAGH